MTQLPIEITDMKHLEDLLKEFTRSKNITSPTHNLWSRRRSVWNAAGLQPGTMRGRFFRYERHQALIFREEMDRVTGLTTVHLIAVQKTHQRTITPRCLSLLASYAVSGANLHKNSYMGWGLIVPRLSEPNLLQLFDEGLSHYDWDDSNRTLPGQAIAYIGY